MKIQLRELVTPDCVGEFIRKFVIFLYTPEVDFGYERITSEKFKFSSSYLRNNFVYFFRCSDTFPLVRQVMCGVRMECQQVSLFNFSALIDVRKLHSR